MKTEYKILWIDDDHRYVRGDRRSIKQFLKEYGVELSIKEVVVTPDACPTTDHSFSEAVSDIELDMVFIDYNMPEQGDKIIQHIRKDLNHYHLPIIFYTGDAKAQATLQQSILQVNNDEESASDIADGIYFCHRSHVFDKAKLILTSLLKKEARPQQGRGLLMDQVSEIDSKILRAINTFWNEVPLDKQTVVIRSVLERAENSQNRTAENFDLLAGKSYGETLSYLNEDIRRWDTNARAIVLRKILQQLDDKTESAQVLLEFYNFIPGSKSLLNLRNEYAHKSVVDLEGEHNDERCRYIRTESRKHSNNLTLLLDSV